MSFPGDNYVVPGANPGGSVDSVGAGTNVTITGTPSNPIVNATGGVQSITAGPGISVTGTPTIPIIGNTSASFLPTYTIYVAPNGNDLTADGTISNPYGTIQAALVRRVIMNVPQVVEIFLFPGTYTGNISIDKGNTYITANPSAYRDEKAAILTGNVTVAPLTPSGFASTIVAFTNIEFSLLTFSSNTSQPEPNYITFTDCAMTGFSATHDVNPSALITIVQYVGCWISNNTNNDTITNNGALLKVLRTEMTSNSSSNSAIVNGGVAPRMDLQYSFIQNTSNTQNLDSLVKYNNTGASTQNTVAHNTFQYIAGSIDLGGNKCAIRYNHTGSIVTQIMAYNAFITIGATNALKKPGAGTITISSYGGNFGTEVANRGAGISVTITLTNT
jgi:hypothetical protein